MKILKNLNLLYVEDEETIIEKYAYFLEESCKELFIARDGEEAYEIYKNNKIHLIIMDLLIPKMSGIVLAKKIREEDDTTPIIALTAHSDREILLDIVDLNFSSYLIKPVLRSDLMNALQKVSKKVDGSRSTPLPCDCSWDPKSKTLFHKEESVFLTKRETKLFELLVEKAGVPCSDDEIFFYVWGDEFDKVITNSSIRTLIKNLRKKIPADLIKNQYGVGYKINF
ncbi:MAG TPA: response regulator transcription factor [Campylobacterales bacterium]|nr:response regulator transcription factor [Campylobacterales bacterium]HHS92014.1 response regulator transcription factor [Campylobacterales bacterium]